MITHLMFENWRSHAATEFVFAKGTNVLVGPMGSGKSSVLDGICFALFGTFPNLQQRRIGLDDMIMNKPSVKEKAKVLLNFRAGGKEYSVKREVLRGRGASSAELREAGQLIEGPQPKRVNERICELLGINYDLFSRAVYSEQNAIDYFLEMPKGQRKQKIDELLRIDRLECGRKALSTVITRLRDRREERKAAASAAKDVEQIPALEKEIANGRAELREREKEKAALEGKKALASDAYSAASRKRTEFQRLDRLARENSGRLGMIRERLAKAERPAEGKAEAAVLHAALVKEKVEAKKREEEKNSLELAVAGLTATIDGLNNQFTKAEENLALLATYGKAPQLEQELDEKANAIDSLNKEFGEKEGRIHEIEEGIAILGGKDRCPVCDALLGGEKKNEIMGARAKEKAGCLAALEALRRQTGTLITEKKELEKKVQQLGQEKQIAERRGELLKEIRAKKDGLEQKKARLASLREGRSAEEIDAGITTLEKALEWYALEDEAGAVEREVNSLRAQIEGLGYDEPAEKKAYDELKEAEKSLALVMQQYRSMGDLIAEKGKRLAELAAIRDEAERNRQMSAYIGAEIDSLQILQGIIPQAQTSLRQEFIETTNVALVDVWKKLYPYKDYNGLKLGIDESGDYILQLKRRDGSWANVEGITSGGERSTACLSLRISLALVLAQKLSWLVLDEPTHNLDRQGIRELSRTLKEYLPGIVEQVFLITHEEELEGAASGYLYRLERNKEEDEPTRIVAESSAA